MDSLNLQKLIEELESDTSDLEEPYAGFFTHDKNDEAGFLKVNKKGLRLITVLFLKALSQSDLKLRIPVDLNTSKDWFDDQSHFTIDFVEINSLKRKPQVVREEKWSDNIPAYGCMAIIIFILSSTVVGMITIGKWIF